MDCKVSEEDEIEKTLMIRAFGTDLEIFEESFGTLVPNLFHK